MLTKVVCDRVEDGLRQSEAIVTVRDVNGRRHFLRVERDFLTRIGEAHFLPVAFVHRDPPSGAILIELPHEAETGANRLWVPGESLLDAEVPMILSDREIRAAMARQAVGIHPEPAAAAWSSTAVDLTLGEPVSLWEPPSGPEGAIIFCPHSPEYDFASLSRQHAREAPLGEAGHVMEPYTFVLGWTVERIRLPHAARIAARVEGKSSLARLGLGVHVTAPTIHSGFGATDDPEYPGSPIRLEIWNIGPLRIKLERGMPICQLIFEWVDGTPEKSYAGQFRFQGPEVSPPAPRTRRKKK